MSEENKTCETCYWWFDDGGTDFRVCVIHTGMQTVNNRMIDFGGTKPMRTIGSFGCVAWKKDSRQLTE